MALLRRMKLPKNAIANLFYEGSVQRLYEVPGHDHLMVAETREQGSVIDVGALFTIEGHDVNRALFRHVVYSLLAQPETWVDVKADLEASKDLSDEAKGKLMGEGLENCCRKGLRTHHVGMFQPETGKVFEGGLPDKATAFNVVEKFQILKPERTDYLGVPVYDYSRYHGEDRYVIPLEYIVRFGMTSASSVLKRYERMDGPGKRAFERELGVSEPLRAWHFLSEPISDLTTKFEPEDRMLNKQEASAISGLSGESFSQSGQIAILAGLVVRRMLEPIGLSLWDLKWEFAMAGGELVLVDTIDTDSIRATKFISYGAHRFVCHFNKQAMRDYYTVFHPEWLNAIKMAKAAGASKGMPFTELLSQGQEEGRYPINPAVAEEFLQIQKEKMAAIRWYLLGERSRSSISALLDEIGKREIEYYHTRGKLEGYHKLNGIEGQSGE